MGVGPAPVSMRSIARLSSGLAEPMDGDRMPATRARAGMTDAAAPVSDGIIDPSRPVVAARRARYIEGALQPDPHRGMLGDAIGLEDFGVPSERGPRAMA